MIIIFYTYKHDNYIIKQPTIYKGLKMKYQTQRVIVINPTERTITEQEIIAGGEDVSQDQRNQHMKGIYEMLGCDMMEVACNIEAKQGTNSLFVDEEGLFKDDQQFFKFTYDGGNKQPLAGNGLIMGFDYTTGESPACTMTIQEVADRVQWLYSV